MHNMLYVELHDSSVELHDSSVYAKQDVHNMINLQF